MSYLEKINDLLNKILMILGGMAVLSLMILATGNVVMRIFHMPFRGAYEIVSFLGAIVIAFALGYTQKKKNHIVVDILTQKFSKKVNRVLDGVNYLVTTIFFGIVSWQIYVWGMKIWRCGELSETLKIPFYPFIFSVSAGFAIFSLTLITDLFKTVLNVED